jgi:coenzyme F420 hydrogenase subunit beta
MLVRNAKGWKLLDLVRQELELSEPTESGDRKMAMSGFLSQMGKPYTKGSPKPIKKLIAFMMRRFGPKGLEFARTRVEMKLTEGLYTVRRKAPHREALYVPRYAYKAIQQYTLPGEDAPPSPPEAKPTRKSGTSDKKKPKAEPCVTAG